MTRYDDMLAKEARQCDWCGQPIERGQPITQVSRDSSEPDSAPADPRWFHSRCGRQFVADAYW
jgi:hypothetical protein